VNTSHKCKCGKRKSAQKPACSRCFEAYLEGDSPDTYLPRNDGLLVPRECTREWEREQCAVAARQGKPIPFHDGSTKRRS
jgi:hypothetical protein